MFLVICVSIQFFLILKFKVRYALYGLFVKLNMLDSLLCYFNVIFCSLIMIVSNAFCLVIDVMLNIFFFLLGCNCICLLMAFSDSEDNYGDLQSGQGSPPSGLVPSLSPLVPVRDQID